MHLLRKENIYLCAYHSLSLIQSSLLKCIKSFTSKSFSAPFHTILTILFVLSLTYARVECNKIPFSLLKVEWLRLQVVEEFEGSVVPIGP